MGIRLYPIWDGSISCNNTTSWEWIKKAIKESDYFILIVGGKNGSIEKSSGISYTRKEYGYALLNEIPTISFIVKDE